MERRVRRHDELKDSVLYDLSATQTKQQARHHERGSRRIPDATKMQPTNTLQTRIADLDSSPRLPEQQYEGAPEVSSKRARRGRSVFKPPSFGVLYLGRSAVRNAQTQRHVQRMRSSRVKSSSAEMVAPRSASAMASRSSASSSEET